jgi:hypothetical protein
VGSRDRVELSRALVKYDSCCSTRRIRCEKNEDTSGYLLLPHFLVKLEHAKGRPRVYSSRGIGPSVCGVEMMAGQLYRNKVADHGKKAENSPFWQ